MKLNKLGQDSLQSTSSLGLKKIKEKRELWQFELILKLNAKLEQGSLQSTNRLVFIKKKEKRKRKEREEGGGGDAFMKKYQLASVWTFVKADAYISMGYGCAGGRVVVSWADGSLWYRFKVTLAL